MNTPSSFFQRCRIIFFTLIVTASLVQAETIFLENNNEKPVELGAHYEVFSDDSHLVSINDILSPNNMPAFKPLPQGDTNLGFRTEAIWLKTKIRNSLKTDASRMLEFKNPLHDHLDVYIVHGLSNRILSHHTVGDLQKFNNRPYQHSNFIIPITIKAQSDSYLYFRIDSESPMNADATLWQSNAFSKHSRINFLWQCLYAGILLALLIYNFLLFISLRNISHLYYALLTSAMLLTFGSLNGLWFELLWPNLPQWHKLSLPFGLTLVGIFSTQFIRSLLPTPRSLKLDKVLYLLLIAFLLTMIASLFAPLAYTSIVILSLVFILCFTGLTAYTSLSIQGHRDAQIAFLAWLALLIGTLSFVSYHLGWLQNTWFTRHAFSLSGIAFIFLLSFALTYRIVITRTQTTLFHKKMVAENDTQIAVQVSEQTKELTQLNEKLKQQEAVLKKLAFYDSLTGLANQTFIQEQLKQLLTNSRRNKTKITALLLDIDDFKRINTEHGHKTGDEVLITIANRLRSTLRENDVVGRLGCNKFIVLLESVAEDEHEPQEVAKKIRNALSQTMTMDWFILHLHTSIGLASFPHDGRNAEELINSANSAMQIEKSGK